MRFVFVNNVPDWIIVKPIELFSLDDVIDVECLAKSKGLEIHAFVMSQDEFATLGAGFAKLNYVDESKSPVTIMGYSVKITKEKDKWLYCTN